MTITDWDSIDQLITAFIDHEPVKNLKSDLKPLQYIINKYKFALVFLHHNDLPDTYNIYDLFKTELSVWIENEKGNKIILSQYIILKVDEYLTLSNIKFDVLLSSYQNIPDTRTKYEQGNNVLLDLLCAYDKSTDRKDVLLKTAESFSDWLMTAPEDVLSYKIRLLNKMQIIRRIRDFNIDEVKEIYNLIEDDMSDQSILVGAHLLLGNQIAAEMHYEKLSLNQQEEFKTYPIYHFWKELKEV